MEWEKSSNVNLFEIFFTKFDVQQVDDKYIRTIHLHSSSGSNGSNGSTGKNSHRSKSLTNSQSRDRHESSIASRARSLASQPSGHGEYFTHKFSFLLSLNSINSNAIKVWLLSDKLHAFSWEH